MRRSSDAGASLYYLYQEYEGQEGLPLFDAKALTAGYLQLFRENRFSGSTASATPTGCRWA